MASHPIRSMVMGRDAVTSTIFASEELTNDWFGSWLREHSPEHRPATLRDLLTKVLPPRTWSLFGVGDGTHLIHAPNNAHIPRNLRLTVIATPDNASISTQHPGIPNVIIGDIGQIVRSAFARPPRAVPTLCISGSSLPDDRAAFLQVASWDHKSQELRFYQRQGRIGYDTSAQDVATNTSGQSNRPPLWAYLGASGDAFTPDTLNKGPFCGHVNGALVMKELSLPWIHWQSSRNTMVGSFAPDSDIRNDPLLQPENANPGFTFISVADRLETIVRNSVRRWYESRISRDFGAPNDRKDAKNVYHWMRHVLSNTTFNIAGAAINSDAVLADREPSKFRVPHDFFMNDQSLPTLFLQNGVILEDLGYTELPFIQPDHYNQARLKLGLGVIYKWHQDSDKLGVAFEHEGQVPWMVIVPSFEDTHGIAQIAGISELFSLKELCSLLMVDFPNPVFSRRREQLMQYVPQESSYTNGQYDLSKKFREQIAQSAAAKDPTSPEAEYLSNLNTGDDFLDVFAARMVNYRREVSTRMQTPEGVEDYMRLAESRRRMFRPHPGSDGPGTNGLSEFKMTLPFARNIPANEPWLEMMEDATVRKMDDQGQEYVKKKLEALQLKMHDGSMLDAQRASLEE